MPTSISPLHILCDMDGTLVETEGLKDEAWRRAVGDVIGSAPDRAGHRALYAALVGRPGAQIAVELVRRYGLSVAPEELWQLRERHRRMLYQDPAVLRSLACTPIIGFLRRVRDGLGLAGRGSIVLVTTAGEDQVDAIVAALDVSDLFDRVFCGLEKTKENPACYRAALEALRCQPGECLALEDTLVGYEAARSVGIPCLLLPSDYTRDQRLDAAWPDATSQR